MLDRESVRSFCKHSAMPPKNDDKNAAETIVENNGTNTQPPLANGKAPSSTQPPTEQATMEQKFRENVAEMFDVMKHSFMFKYALSHTRVYTGSNIPLKDLVEDIRKGEEWKWESPVGL